MTENNSGLTFETAMKKLEETVRRLESGDLTLTESIERYKESMQLVQFCRQQLDQAELEISKLVEGPDGIALEPLDPVDMPSANGQNEQA
ncbi:exodeoxyribonuclease VII small subunit [Alicyclobacillus cycloheptanicus]|uniref:Exodeoxyribonuclease 7 small subunit n=1 Tax=Alicyclobacillus cycloheptanicus TaxID=1457 RepID=A0ABT9XDK4_9BACL|nr:exodeoxyribonuclease VII small subunit [Alicyclobacillus cycloheptanicus]MDQ0188367.1 exodeoxyribonuclease VII small subunit [Alicyclobacillus cycloheptanicus]WDM01075.1 exodeoxyribonuclease VII small subunit [Alicyclobacillus cycloheptanicus]